MRFTDLMMAFPALLLAIALAAIFAPSLWIVALVIALVNWVQIARVIYTETTALAERDYHRGGARARRRPGRGVLFRHILPHLVPTMLVWGTLGIATTVLLEATLSFLGVGVQPPTPSWGNIIFESQSYFLTAPWLVFIPGAAILLLALAFNLVGDALRDALDPTGRGAADDRLSRPAAGRLGADPDRRHHRHLRAGLPDAGRSGAPDRRAQRHAGDGRIHPPPARPRPPRAGAILRLISGIWPQGDLGRSYIQKTDVGELI